MSGEVVGFKFGVRLANYRGIYLSLVNGFYVNMDGVEYGEEDLMLEVNGQRPRTMAELAKCPFEPWDLQDEAMLHVKKPGGLEKGMHTLGSLPSRRRVGHQPAQARRRRRQDRPRLQLCPGTEVRR